MSNSEHKANTQHDTLGDGLGPDRPRLFSRRVVKPKLVVCGVLALLAAMTVIGLWLASDEPNSRDNGFTRQYARQAPVPLRAYALPKDVRYLAGRIGDSLYFSTLVPGEVLVLDMPTGHIRRRYLIGDPELRRKIDASNMLEANSHGIMLYDGKSRSIASQAIGGEMRYHEVSEPFTRAVRFSANGIALRKFKRGERDQYLYRFDLTRDTALDESRVTDVVQDGGLVTGGMLAFDADAGQGVYLTRYANRITMLDTNMRITATGHTIDTFQHYTIGSRVIANGAGAKITNSGSGYFVNKAVALSGGILFVNSFVKADNETADQFRAVNVIDVYETSYPGEAPGYRASYPLPTAKQARIRNMQVYRDTLAALTPEKLTLYRLTL